MNTLTLHTTPPIVLTREILALGTARSAVNGEVPSMAVRLDNARGDLTTLFAVPPLRARAVVTDAAGLTLFTGQVQAVTLAAEITLDLES